MFHDMGDLCILKLPTMLKALFPSEGKGQDGDDDEISHVIHSVDNQFICTL